MLGDFPLGTEPLGALSSDADAIRPVTVVGGAYPPRFGKQRRRRSPGLFGRLSDFDELPPEPEPEAEPHEQPIETALERALLARDIAMRKVMEQRRQAADPWLQTIHSARQEAKVRAASALMQAEQWRLRRN